MTRFLRNFVTVLFCLLLVVPAISEAADSPLVHFQSCGELNTLSWHHPPGSHSHIVYRNGQQASSVVSNHSWYEVGSPLETRQYAVTSVSGGFESSKSNPVECGPDAKWTLNWTDNFDTLDTSQRWHPPYDDPTLNNNHCWDPDHVYVQNSRLVIDAYLDTSLPAPCNAMPHYASGGIASRKKQTYGKLIVRSRFDAGKGISDALMFWPSGCWPPEIDFAESGGSNNTRNGFSAFFHWGACGDNNTIPAGSVSVDRTQFQDIGVEWTPGRLDFTLNEAVWSTILSSQVPSFDHYPVLQTQSCNSTCPDSTTPGHVKEEFDWLAAYSYLP